ncbi:hypothetical protein V8G54_020483 [Vigna mungo]|uniref:Uncharacterized protein n=1 Tax=Vigna mungo TaxID=3915 RepID=A0AAQ3NCG5_VIGMU
MPIAISVAQLVASTSYQWPSSDFSPIKCATTCQGRSPRSHEDLKLDLQRSTSKNKELVIKRDNLLTERGTLRNTMLKLENDNKFLVDEVVNEHVLNFETTLAQCNLVFHVPINDPHLNVEMIVVNGELMPMHVPPPSTPVVQDVEQPPIIEVIEETDGVNAQIGELMPMHVPPPSTPIVQAAEQPPIVEVIEETDGVNAQINKVRVMKAFLTERWTLGVHLEHSLGHVKVRVRKMFLTER